MSTNQNDRVSYSYGFKVPGAEQYSSVNVNVSYSTDVRDGETPEKAMERARAFVHAEAGRETPPAAEPPRTPPPGPSQRVEDEAFDPNNQTHFRIAHQVFDHLDIRSDKARSYKLHVLLPGKRVGDLRRIVEDDEADYRQEGARQPFRVAKGDGRKSNWDGGQPRRRW